MFHADFCHSLGIKLEEGIKAGLGGVVGGAKADLYFHKIKILVGSYQVTTMAGFSKEISVAGLLGRRGFRRIHRTSRSIRSIAPSLLVCPPLPAPRFASTLPQAYNLRVSEKAPRKPD